MALRTLEERVSLERRMAKRAPERKHTGLAARWEEQARAKDADAEVPQNVLLQATEPVLNE